MSYLGLRDVYTDGTSFLQFFLPQLRRLGKEVGPFFPDAVVCPLPASPENSGELWKVYKWVRCSSVVYFSEILTILHKKNVVRKSAFLAVFVACRWCATFWGAPVDHPGWSILPQGQHEPQIPMDSINNGNWYHGYFKKNHGNIGNHRTKEDILVYVYISYMYVIVYTWNLEEPTPISSTT